MEREITLGDYGRVLWRGKWVLVVAGVAAALIALVTSVVRETQYTASSLVYLGLATTARTGVPVPTPLTTQVTAQRVLRADRFVEAAATGAGVDAQRVRDGVEFTVERVPGAAGGTQPTVATIRYTDNDRETAIAVANAYSEGVFDYVKGRYDKVLGAYQTLVDDGKARITEIEDTIDQQRRTGGAGAQTAIFALQQELATLRLDVDENVLGLAKTEQIEQPELISTASTAASSARPGERLRTIVFGAILGLLIGAIVTFIWRGSPAGRGANTP